MAFPVETVLGGIFSAFGASKANKARRAEAARNRAFQERMSSTAYQRQTKDLELAGLNRILGYTKGGPASTPGGATAQQQDIITPAINTALSVKRLKQEVKNLQAQEALTRAKTKVIAPATAAGETIGGWMEDIRDAIQNQPNTGKAARATTRRNLKKLLQTLKGVKSGKKLGSKPMTIFIRKGKND